MPIQDKTLTSGVLCAARRMLKSGVKIEEQLAKTRNKCSQIGAPICQAVLVTLTKLVQDIAGTPLVLADYVSDPTALRCILTVLHYILTVVKPDELHTESSVTAGSEAAKKICKDHNLPLEVGELAAILVEEIAMTFQKLDIVLQPPYVKKCRNAGILRDRVKHFLRSVQADIFVVAFASLKLAVCMRALAEGCFQMKKGDKRLLEGLLEQVQAKAMTLATLNQVHRTNIMTSVRMAGPRSQNDM